MGDTKTVDILVAFVKPVNVTEYMKDILEAYDYTSLNLLGRHRIKLVNLKTANNGFVITMRMPDNLSDFSYGNHLRGLAQYLLKTYPEKYKELRVGKRLFYFHELPKEYEETCKSVNSEDEKELLMHLREINKLVNKMWGAKYELF